MFHPENYITSAHMSQPARIILEWIVPIVGDILAILLFLSPVKTLIKVHVEQKLGDVNPIPFTMMILNCTVWTLYGMRFKPPTIFFICLPNLIGIPIGFFAFAITYPLASAAVKRSLLKVLSVLTMGIIPFLFLTFAISGGADPFPQILGIVTVSAQLTFFASPLNSIAHIVRTKSSSSIHLGLALMSTISSLLWTVFGLVSNDWFMFIPNFCSMTLGIVQLSLRFLFPQNLRQQLGDFVDTRISMDEDSSENFHAGII